MIKLIMLGMVAVSAWKISPYVAAQGVGHTLQLLSARDGFFVRSGLSRLQLLLRMEASHGAALSGDAIPRLSAVIQRWQDRDAGEEEKQFGQMRQGGKGVGSLAGEGCVVGHPGETMSAVPRLRWRSNTCTCPAAPPKDITDSAVAALLMLAGVEGGPEALAAADALPTLERLRVRRLETMDDGATAQHGAVFADDAMHSSSGPGDAALDELILDIRRAQTTQLTHTSTDAMSGTQ